MYKAPHPNRDWDNLFTRIVNEKYDAEKIFAQGVYIDDCSIDLKPIRNGVIEIKELLDELIEEGYSGEELLYQARLWHITLLKKLSKIWLEDSYDTYSIYAITDPNWIFDYGNTDSLKDALLIALNKMEENTILVEKRRKEKENKIIENELKEKNEKIRLEQLKSDKKNKLIVENLFKKGEEYLTNKDYPNAVLYFSKAILIDPEDKFNKNLFINRSKAKLELFDYLGAIKDLTTTIDLGNKNSMVYFERGVLHYKIEKFKEAIIDFSGSIEFVSENKEAYFYRGLSEINFGEKDKGYLDLSTAGELGYFEAYAEIKKNFIK